MTTPRPHGEAIYLDFLSGSDAELTAGLKALDASLASGLHVTKVLPDGPGRFLFVLTRHAGRKYEYCIEPHFDHFPHDGIEYLNRMGAEGWRLVATSPRLHYFEREVLP